MLVEGATSDSIPVINGVQQGTVLGPLLFLLFINDLLDSVLSNTRLFADDCIFYRRIKNQRDCDILQDDIDKLASWEKKWCMSFHPDKCSTTRVSRSRNSMIGFLRRHLRPAMNHQKQLHIFLSSGPYWSTVAQSGTPTPKTTSTNLKWFSIERLGMLETDHNASSVTSMLEHLEWESLESRRVKCQFTMLFKIINDLVHIPLDHYLTIVSTRTRSHHSHKFRHVPASSDYFKNSFFPRTIVLWNSLPASLAGTPSLVSFKQELSTMSF